MKSDTIKHPALNHAKIPRFRSECRGCFLCFFFSWPAFLLPNPYHPTLQLHFSNCCRKGSCFPGVLGAMLSRGLERCIICSARSVLGEKMDEELSVLHARYFQSLVVDGILDFRRLFFPSFSFLGLKCGIWKFQARG